MKKLSQILLMVFCLTGCFGNQTTPPTNPNSASGSNPPAAPASTPASTPAPEPKPTPTPAPSTSPSSTPGTAPKPSTPSAPAPTLTQPDAEAEDETPERNHEEPGEKETDEFAETKPEAEPASVPHPSGKKEVNILFLSPWRPDNAEVINIVYNHLSGKKFEDKRDIIVPLPVARSERGVNVDKFKGLNRNAANAYQLETDKYVVTLWTAARSGPRDEIDAQMLAAALSKKKINAVCVIASPENFVRDDLSKSALANIGRILPKLFEQNVIGVFNNAAAIQEEMRPDYADDLSKLLGLNQTAAAIFLFGTFASHYSHDLPEVAEIQWNKDKAQVLELLEKSAALSPVSGKGLGKIQAMIAEMSDIAQRLSSLQEKEIYLKLLELESKHPSTLLKQQDFVKAGEKEFGKNLSEELRKQKMKELRVEQGKLVRAYKKIEKWLDQYAISSVRSPYVIFLENKVGAEPEISATEMEKNLERAFWEAKLRDYKSIQ